MAAAETKVSPEEDMAAATMSSSQRSVPDDSPLRQIQTTGKSIVSCPFRTPLIDYPPSSLFYTRRFTVKAAVIEGCCRRAHTSLPAGLARPLSALAHVAHTPPNHLPSHLPSHSHP